MAFFENIGKKISDAGQGISRSTKNMAEISKLSGTVNDDKKRIAGYYAAIGEAYYKRHRDDPECEEPVLVGNITKLLGEIDRLEEEIRRRRGVGKCPACGADVAQGASFCSACGARLPEETAAAPACPGCGRPLREGDSFCTFCGSPIKAPEPESTEDAPPAEEPAEDGGNESE